MRIRPALTGVVGVKSPLHSLTKGALGMGLWIGVQ